MLELLKISNCPHHKLSKYWLSMPLLQNSKKLLKKGQSPILRSFNYAFLLLIGSKKVSFCRRWVRIVGSIIPKMTRIIPIICIAVNGSCRTITETVTATGSSMALNMEARAPPIFGMAIENK